MNRWACTFIEDHEANEYIYCYASTDGRGFRVYVKIDGDLAEIVVSSNGNSLTNEGRKELAEHVYQYLRKNKQLVEANCRQVKGKYVVDILPRLNVFKVWTRDWRMFMNRVVAVYTRCLE